MQKHSKHVGRKNKQTNIAKPIKKHGGNLSCKQFLVFFFLGFPSIPSQDDAFGLISHYKHAIPFAQKKKIQ